MDLSMNMLSDHGSWEINVITVIFWNLECRIIDQRVYRSRGLIHLWMGKTRRTDKTRYEVFDNN